jgi:hypothetical protein
MSSGDVCDGGQATTCIACVRDIAVDPTIRFPSGDQAE